MSVNEPDYARSFLHDCRVSLRVGLRDFEKTKSQVVIVNVEVEMEAPFRFEDLTESDTQRVVSYGLLYRFVHDELPKLGHIPLLETVAERIITFCFQDERIRKVKVRLEKPDFYQGTAGIGIELQRMRPKP